MAVGGLDPGIVPAIYTAPLGRCRYEGGAPGAVAHDIVIIYIKSLSLARVDGQDNPRVKPGDGHDGERRWRRRATLNSAPMPAGAQNSTAFVVRSRTRPFTNAREHIKRYHIC